MAPRHLALMAFLALAATPALAAEIAAPIGNQTERLPLPKGYCTLDHGRPDEEARFQLQQKVLGEKIRLLGMAIDCRQLAALRAKQAQGFKLYLQFALPIPDGVPSLIDDTQRQSFIAAGAKLIPALDLKTLLADVVRRGAAAGLSIATQKFGLLGQDENGLYFGGIGSVNNAQVAFVGANTIAGNRAITVSFYDSDISEKTIPALYAAARSEAAALIAANAGGTPAAPAGLH
jgi:hypothetical protein